MLKSEFADKSKSREEKMPGWPMNGIPIKRQVGMIYWYSWGEHTFDIRVMRRVLGLPEDHPADKWFMSKKPDACGSFNEMMNQLQEAVGERSFADVIAMHDKALEEESEAEIAASKARANTKQTAAYIAPFEGCPF